MRGVSARALGALTLFLSVSCSERPEATDERLLAVPITVIGEGDREPEAVGEGGLMMGRAVPPALARKPRFSVKKPPLGLRVLPDGDLSEWGGALRWIGGGVRLKTATASSGKADLDARIAMASYTSGLSLTVEVKDDRHLGARALSAMRQSDHLQIELWPQRRPDGDEPLDGVLGLRLRLGTVKQLVTIDSSKEAWRQRSVSSAGVSIPGGYRVESRIPMSVMTPLPVARVDRLHYRITIHDADEPGRAAAATLRFEGTFAMKPAMMVPEAVQKRGSIRVCLATQKGAMWSYRNGWRCGVPFVDEILQEDDVQPRERVGLAYTRVPEPAKIVWIRERLMFVNMLGLGRGIGALLDRNDTILSTVPLGVVGAQSPGNARTRESDAEPLKLPDGTYAVAVTHAIGDTPGRLGGRCAAGHRVFLSILALRGCLKSTPHAPAPEPESPPYIEEVFRNLLEDCRQRVANDWSLSKDRQVIKIHSSLHPTRPGAVWVFRGGRYRRRAVAESAGARP